MAMQTIVAAQIATGMYDKPARRRRSSVTKNYNTLMAGRKNPSLFERMLTWLVSF